MNSALPSPQPARKPTMPPIVSDEAREAREHDDQHEPGDEGVLGADPAGDPAGDEHRDRGDDEVAGEQQRDLARRGVQLGGERGQDRVDEPDAHERDHAGEGDGPHRSGLAEGAAGRSCGEFLSRRDGRRRPWRPRARRGRRRRGRRAGRRGPRRGPGGARRAPRGRPGDGDEHAAPVGGVGCPFDQAARGQPADQPGHRGLRDALGLGELGDAPGAAAFEVGEGRGGHQAQPATRGQPRQQGDEPVELCGELETVES